jgi:hypothetical protein
MKKKLPDDKRILARRRYQTYLLYSQSGGGKTSLSATAPAPIILDSNQGVMSVAERPGLEHIRSMDVFKFADLERGYKNCLGTGKHDWSKKYKTISFDHFDDIQSIILDELVEAAMEKDDRRDDTIDRREYGIMGSKLKRYVRKFKAVPMHKILICGAKEDEESGQLKPSLIGALGSALPYLCDHVIYLRVAPNGRRYLHLDSGEKNGEAWFAKTRAWWLTDEQKKIRIRREDTTAMTKLFDLIAAGPKGKTTAAEEEE